MDRPLPRLRLRSGRKSAVPAGYFVGGSLNFEMRSKPSVRTPALRNGDRLLGEFMIRLVILAAAMALVALPAHASQTLAYTFVQCLGEEVMVRFEFGSGLAPLTQPEAGRWKNVPAVSGAQGCKLASGAAAIVLQGDQQTTNGSGGADPPGFLSFWVGGKKLISREIYKGGYGSFGLTHNSIHYSPGSLTRCTYPQATDAYTDISKVICKAESLDITGLPADPLA